MKTNRLAAALRLAACVLLLAFAAQPAAAQNTDTYFYTPNGGGVNGAVGMCLNAQNKAVPCSASGVAPSPVAVSPYQGQSAGASQPQLSVTTGAVTTLTVPAGTLAFVVSVRPGAASAVNYCIDGATPTTGANGNCRQLAAGGQISYSGIAYANAFKAIGATATTAIDVEYQK